MTNNYADVEFDDQRTTAIILIDERVYSKQAVLRAFYWLGKNLHSRIDDCDGHLRVTIGLRVTTPTLSQPQVKKIDEWLPEIFDALLDSQLRVEIQTETAAVRELIIAKAFAESGILEDPPPGTFGDPVRSRDEEANTLITIQSKPAN
jgi:His-Xaa-Ser system protein HxsD